MGDELDLVTTNFVDDLNDQQRAAVLDPSPVLSIIAGAGSGKTRVLTRRIAHRIANENLDPQRIVALTFTRQAANELRVRTTASTNRTKISASTFHAAAYSQLRKRWEDTRVNPPELLTSKIAFVARIMRTDSRTKPLDVTSEIEWAKAHQITALNYADRATEAQRQTSLGKAEIADYFERYEKEKLKRRVVDFDDLLRLATRDLRADEKYAAAIRWRCRHLFVDEFQDVNALQFDLLREWVGPEPDLCVVGDPNQAIYTWNGADARYLNDLASHFGDVSTVTLTENYRSTPEILGVANTVLSQTSARPLILTPNNAHGTPPNIISYDDPGNEARSVVRHIRDTHQPGTSWSQHAILVRTNSQLVIFEEALRAAHVPYRAQASASLLKQPEVKEIVSTFRRSAIPLGVLLADLQENLRVDESITDDRRSTLSELVRMGHEYQALGSSDSGSSFVGWLSTVLSNDTSRIQDGVDLLTFHGAKGLEWPSVYLCGLEEGLVPISRAITSDAQDEEQRLFYVAITRAQKRLQLSWCTSRTFGERIAKRSESPMLTWVEMGLDFIASSSSPQEVQRNISNARAQAKRARLNARTDNATRSKRTSSSKRSSRNSIEFDDLSTEDQALFAALKSWRTNQARAAIVPAYLVLANAPLLEIALQRPTNTAALQNVSGIGPTKADQFGQMIIDIVNEHS